MRVFFLEICKVPCKRVSLPIGALFGEPGGGLFGPLREMKSISGFLSWTWRPVRFKSGSHLEH